MDEYFSSSDTWSFFEQGAYQNRIENMLLLTEQIKIGILILLGPS